MVEDERINVGRFGSVNPREFVFAEDEELEDGLEEEVNTQEG